MQTYKILVYRIYKCKKYGEMTKFVKFLLVNLSSLSDKVLTKKNKLLMIKSC